jgi:UDP-N-acetyl-D-mannosaminuronic acid dehydrogenase
MKQLNRSPEKEQCMNRSADAVVVGAGYVGLTLGLHLASRGLSILAVDSDHKKVEELRLGKTPVFEKEIQNALSSCAQAKKIQFVTETQGGCNYWILSISYFPGDTEHYKRVLKTIKGSPGQPPAILIRGTVPVGYTRKHLLPMLEEQFGGPLDEAFYLATVPERSLSGAALEELGSLPQLVGGTNESFKRASQLFEKSGVSCLQLPSLEAGEVAKTFTNFARLVQFNLSNYLGVLCHKFDISEEIMFQAVKEGYPRLNFLSSPGPGVGGFCLPKDSLVLHDGLRERVDSSMDDLALFPRQQFDLNQHVIQFHSKQVKQMVSGAKRVLALGVAFKGDPQTDDTRDSVGLAIIRNIVLQTSVEVYDRTVSDEKLRSLELNLAPSPLELSRYDAILILNNDPEYRNILCSSLRDTDRESVILYDPWRSLLTGKESIFQESFPLQTLRMHRS